VLSVRRRRVLEYARAKKRRQDPDRIDISNARECSRGGRRNQERRRGMLIRAGGNEGDRAAVLGPICIAMDAFVQFRRDAQRQRPDKSEADKRGDESSGARAHCLVHRDAIFCLTAGIAILFRKADMLSRFVAAVVPIAELNEVNLAAPMPRHWTV
jgi:hypothetical protein